MEHLNKVNWYVMREKEIPPKLYKLFVDSHNVPPYIKQKLARYQHVIKKKKMQKGAGFRINIDNDNRVAFMIGDDEIDIDLRGMQRTDNINTIVSMQIGDDTFTFDSTADPIGAGAFASVYELQPTEPCH